jgi:hypothetical protein
MSQLNRRLLINASEVGEFVYCAKAWYLKRCGEIPQGPHLDEGVTFHERHETTVSQAVRLQKAGERLSLTGLLLLIALALIWFVTVVSR